MNGQALLRDLVEIPDEVHAGDFVLALAKGVGQKSTITRLRGHRLAGRQLRPGPRPHQVRRGDRQLAGRLPRWLVRLRQEPLHGRAACHPLRRRGRAREEGPGGCRRQARPLDARAGSSCSCPTTCPTPSRLDAAILGGYVAHVAKTYPGKPLPDVYVDDQLIEDAKADRQRLGDEAFIAQLPASDEEAAEWGTPDWDSRSLDEALTQPPGGAERRRLVGDLLAGPFRRYARAVRADQESYVPLDEGLSVISKHAKNVLGFDAIVLLLDELVLWLAGYIGDHAKVSTEAQKVSKLVESAELERPAPVISFVPRQRDLRDLVRKAAAGNEVTSLFDTLKYWDGRFDHIPLTTATSRRSCTSGC